MSILSYGNANLKTSGSGRTDEEVMALYEEWPVKHGKSYNGLGERDNRFESFKVDLRYKDEQNTLPNRTYQLGLNQFADLSNEEYCSTYLGTRPNPKRRLAKTSSDRYCPKVGDSLPNSIDWREKGAVLPVKDQGSCGMKFS